MLAEPPEAPPARVEVAVAGAVVEAEVVPDDEAPADPDDWLTLARAMALSSRVICEARLVIAVSASCWARDTVSMAAAQERNASAPGPSAPPAPGVGDPVELGVEVVVGVPVSEEAGVVVDVSDGVSARVSVGVGVGAVVGAAVVGAGVPVGCGGEVGRLTCPVGLPAVDPSTGAQTCSSVSSARCDAAKVRCTALVLSRGGEVVVPAEPLVRDEPEPAAPPEEVEDLEVPVMAVPVVVPVVVLLLVAVLAAVAAVDAVEALEADAVVVVDVDPSVTSDASSWARNACAESRLARRAVESMVARVCPADTRSPTAAWRLVTVPPAAKEAVTWLRLSGPREGQHLGHGTTRHDGDAIVGRRGRAGARGRGVHAAGREQDGEERRTGDEGPCAGT